MNNNCKCQNGEKCIPDNNSLVSNEKFVCICPNCFSKDRCEIIDNQLIFSFSK